MLLNKTLFYFIGLGFVLFVGLHEPVYAFEIQCPATIDLTEQAQNIPIPWQSVINRGRSGHRLENVFLYFHHPQEMGTLVPDEDKYEKKRAVAIWRFPGKDSRDHWLTCVYSDTNVMLARALPNDLTHCTVSFKMDGPIKLGVTNIICE
ncbi:MAG: STY0301 family protein [Pseudomonadota bacterium]